MLVSVEGHRIHRGLKSYGIELDQEDLRDLERDEESDKDHEIPPPLIGYVYAVAHRKVGRP